MADADATSRARPSVTISTDGACKGNPGIGGWGAVLRAGDGYKELQGAVARTTNNRMELTAAIEALQALKSPCRVVLRTDSKYVHDAVDKKWIAGWARRGWRTAAGDAVKNQELWEALAKELARHDITMCWVKGHSGDPDNERADALANAAITALKASVLV